MSHYLVNMNRRESAKIRMIFCPHAGGSSLGYLKFIQACPGDIELFILDLPGRNRVINEPWPIQWEEILERIFSEIIKDHRPTIFLGHSFGSLMALELSHRFLESHHQTILGISGLNAPTLSRWKTRRKITKLPDIEFLAELKKIGHSDEDLPEHFLNLIKSDLKMLDNYLPSSRRTMTTLVFGGQEDPVTTLEGLTDWEQVVELKSPPFIYPGNHFHFLLEHIQLIMRELHNLI